MVYLRGFFYLGSVPDLNKPQQLCFQRTFRKVLAALHHGQLVAFNLSFTSFTLHPRTASASAPPVGIEWKESCCGSHYSNSPATTAPLVTNTLSKCSTLSWHLGCLGTWATGQRQAPATPADLITGAATKQHILLYRHCHLKGSLKSQYCATTYVSILSPAAAANSTGNAQNN